MNNENYIIKTENLGFSYDDYSLDSSITKEPLAALRNINIAIRRGEYVSVLGHNGSGKSTLAKLLNMILTPTVGRVLINGAEIKTEDDIFSARQKIGMVFQNPDNQLVANVVEEDVAFGPENLGLEREEIRRRVVYSLNLVGMQEYTHHAPHKLSGGQKQRIAIAGIIAMKPECIIFDESTAMLDPIGRRDVMTIMEKLNKEEGITIINITHYMDEAARADRIIVINDGELLMDDAPKEIFKMTSKLHEVGLEAPQSVELIASLRKSGLDIDGDILTETECVEALLSYIDKRGENNE